MKELTHASVAELSALLSKKEVSAKEIAQAYLDKIEDKKSLNAFLDVRPEVTLKEAEAADRKIAEGTASPLTGVPIAHKDIFVTRNWASTAASRMLENYMSPFDATVVERIQEAGLVCLGKTQLRRIRNGLKLRPTAPMAKTFNPWNATCRSRRLFRRFRFLPLPQRLTPAASPATDTGGSIRRACQPSAASPVLSPRTAVPVPSAA